ncbi:MAG: LPXTG cell wall anchor domain-containing protein [Anaerolineales bacterium]
MAFEDMDLEDNEFDLESDDSSPPEESTNRTFYIVAAAIGGVMLLSLICLALYALVYAPQQRNRQATQVAAINAQNTQVAQAAVETGLAAKFTATPTITPIPPTATASASPTLVIAQPTQGPVTPTIDRTATVAVLLTEAAAGRLTATPTASALPDTGFVEDVGIPAMVGLALLLVVVIFLTRRLRTAG